MHRVDECLLAACNALTLRAEDESTPVVVANNFFPGGCCVCGKRDQNVAVIIIFPDG